MSVTGGFWAERQRLAAEKTLWEQLEILKGNRNHLFPEVCSHAVENFRIAAGLSNQPYSGTVCNDSEVGKWIEAAAYSLRHYPNSALEKEVDMLIHLIVQAQMPDGYLNTYFQVLYPQERFKHFGFNCDLYNMGHLMEAAAAYYTVTGKRELLDAMCKLGDLLFFGNNATGRVTHVGIYLHDGYYIHCSGQVKINNLDPADPSYLYDPISCSRIDGQEGSTGITWVRNHPWYF